MVVRSSFFVYRLMHTLISSKSEKKFNFMNIYSAVFMYIMEIAVFGSKTWRLLALK